MLNTIDGFGDGFETGTGNYHDGYFYLSVYNNTDSDRDDFVMVYSDQNNASTSTLDFNGNAFRRRLNEDDPTVTEEVINAYEREQKEDRRAQKGLHLHTETNII